MQDPHKIDLGVVQETMLIPLWARAVENERPDAILRDAKAAKMVASIDYDFDKFAKGKASQTGCCLRASIMDEWAREYLVRYPEGTIVEIGVGLDTRFERLDNGRAVWFGLDLPDVVALRRRFFEETDRRRFIAESVLAPGWIGQVQEAAEAASAPVMFVAEGVLMYFEEAQVQRLFRTLATGFPGSTLAFDAMSPLMLRMQKRHDTVKHVDAGFRWGIARIREIEEWDSRFKIERSENFAENAKQYPGRFPLAMRLMWRFWPAMRRAYGIHLARLG